MHTAQLCSTQPFDLISFSLVSSATLSTSAAAISSLFILYQFPAITVISAAIAVFTDEKPPLITFDFASTCTAACESTVDPNAIRPSALTQPLVSSQIRFQRNLCHGPPAVAFHSLKVASSEITTSLL
jgi:hypothetical protein